VIIQGGDSELKLYRWSNRLFWCQRYFL